jgi:asparagine synthase (glutamine-hydrolysing)
LKAAAHIIYHRGPDGQNIWHDSKHQVGLAHARLSIIDLNHGHQPMKNQDATCIAVINGELYDYIKIRTEMQT